MKRLIVYDLDGTLVDTLADITQAANHMRRALGQPPLAATTVRRFVGRGVQELVTGCLTTSDGPRIKEGVRLFRAYYHEHLVEHSRLYPGAREVLAHFADRRQAVLTNKPDPYSTQILTALGVAGCFAQIIAGDSAHPRKPDPAALAALMASVRAARAETLLIGDSPVDIQTGRNAGVLTVAVRHGFSDEAELLQASPDVIVRDFAELLVLARQRAW
jgi:phosphoglycolate phosphatase